MKEKVRLEELFQSISGKDPNTVSEEIMEEIRSLLLSVYLKNQEGEVTNFSFLSTDLTQHFRLKESDLRLLIELLKKRVATGETSWLIAGLLNTYALLLKREARFEKAAEVLSDSLVFLENEGLTNQVAGVLNNIGLCQMYAGKQVAAFKSFSQAMDIFRENDNKIGISITHNNLGLLFKRQGETAKALESLYGSYQICKDLKDANGAVHSLYNIANLYLENGEYDAMAGVVQDIENTPDFDKEGYFFHYRHLVRMHKGQFAKAKEDVDMALLLFKESGNSLNYLDALVNLAGFYHKTGDLEASLRTASECRQIAEEKKLNFSIIKACQIQTEVFLIMDEVVKAEEAANKACQLALEENLPTLQRLSLNDLVKIARIKKDFRAALKLREQSYLLEKELNSIENRKALVRQEIQFEFEKREALLHTQKDLHTKNAELDRLKNVELKKALDDLKAAQSQIVRQNKLAGLGNLVTGIAIEIQKPLEFILEYSADSINLAMEAPRFFNSPQELTPKIKTLSQNLRQMLAKGKTVSGFISSMLDYARIGTAEKQQTELGRLAEEVLRQTISFHKARLNGNDPEITVDISPNLPMITVYPKDIRKALENLVLNAMDAIGNLERDSNSGIVFRLGLSVRPQQDGKALLIQVMDNGEPIEQPNLEKIFEPFFTTRTTGNWIGLGLTISQDIAAAHGGTVQLEVKDGQKFFTMILPTAGVSDSD